MSGRADDLRRGALALALAATVALGGCRREAAERAAPFGGELAAPLPHADVLGYLALVASRDGGWLAKPPLPGGVELAQVAVFAPLAAIAKLAAERPFVAPGAPLAILFLDPDVHGAVAAYAWRGRAADFEAAARAAGLRFDTTGRVLLPGRGRSFEIEVVTESLRRRGRRGDDEEETPLVFSGKERPHLPHAVVERDGIVMVLPARDGARNVFETLVATRLLDADGESLPCLRLASGRVLKRFRDVVSETFRFGVMQLVPYDGNWDESTERTRDRLFRTVIGLVEALSSVEELFACRSEGCWRVYLRMRPGSFGASLLDVAADRPVGELLADVPQDVAFVAGSLAPDVVGELPERLAATRDGFLRRVRVDDGRRTRIRRHGSEPTDDAEQEEERAAAFLDSWTGRFWCAGDLDDSRVGAPRRGQPFDFKADAVGETQLALLFERKEEPDVATGFVPTLVDTLVPKPWRAPLKLASFTVYRPVAVERGLLEVVSGTPDAALRETRMKMDAERLPAEPGPERAFLVLRAPANDLLAGDVYVARVGTGFELTFVATER